MILWRIVLKKSFENLHFFTIKYLEKESWGIRKKIKKRDE